MLGKRKRIEGYNEENKEDEDLTQSMAKLPLELQGMILSHLPEKALTAFIQPDSDNIQKYHYQKAHEVIFARDTTQARERQGTFLHSWIRASTLNPLGMRYVNIEQTLIDRMTAQPLDFDYNLRCVCFLSKQNDKSIIIEQFYASRNIVSPIDLHFLRIMAPFHTEKNIKKLFGSITVHLSGIPPFRPVWIHDQYFKAIVILQAQWSETQLEKLFPLLLARVGTHPRAIDAIGALSNRWDAAQIQRLFIEATSLLSNRNFFPRLQAIKLIGEIAQCWNETHLQHFFSLITETFIESADDDSILKDAVSLAYELEARWNKQQNKKLFVITKKFFKSQNGDMFQDLSIKPLAALARWGSKDDASLIFNMLVKKLESQSHDLTLNEILLEALTLLQPCLNANQKKILFNSLKTLMNVVKDYLQYAFIMAMADLASCWNNEEAAALLLLIMPQLESNSSNNQKMAAYAITVLGEKLKDYQTIKKLFPWVMKNISMSGVVIENLLPHFDEDQRQILFQGLCRLVPPGGLENREDHLRLLYKLSLVADDASLEILRGKFPEADSCADLIKLMRDTYQEAQARCLSVRQGVSTKLTH